VDINKEYFSIQEKFNRIINLFIILEKKTRDFGTGERLYPSEIHNIEMIGRHTGITGQELSRKSGVTKGAVSQIVKRLEKKGYISRRKQAHNKKEILLFLTEKGNIAFKAHNRLHIKLQKSIMQEMKHLNREHARVFKLILDKIEKHLISLL
jgi:DNA-binding MarR family transcriptional regulator